MSEHSTPPSSPIKFAIWCSAEQRSWAYTAFAAVLAVSLISRYHIYLIGSLTDAAQSVASNSAGIEVLWNTAILFFVVYLLKQILWRISGYCGMQWLTRLQAVVYQRLYTYLTRHSAGYFSDRFAGALINKISNASNGFEKLLAMVLWQFTPLAIGFFADIYLTFTAHPYFTWIFIAWFLGFITLNLILVRKLHALAYKYARSTSELKGRLVDSASNIDTVQRAGEIEFERRYIGGYIRSQWEAHKKEWTFSERMMLTNAALIMLFVGLMVAVGVLLLDEQAISIGNFVMIVSLIIGLERRLFFIGQQFAQTMSAYGQAQEGLNELLKPHEVTTQKGAEDLKPRGGKIEFKNVKFEYSEQSVFSDLSLRIDAGQRIGIVGPSGAGKSTLVNLLLRQYNLSDGKILIDDQDISEVELDSLRKNISLVPQTTSLFHRKIYENIIYDQLEASKEEVITAAKLAQADDFIKKLPNQYETLVGERGVKLSGGQRQRISIARVLLKKAQILVLDEATSSLDSESEAAIQAALEKAIEGRTVIAIAHRLSTLRKMDRIIVLSEGEIVEDGTHEDLLALNGLYARLWNSQIGGFIQD